jgi:hypothetical protein
MFDSLCGACEAAIDTDADADRAAHETTDFPSEK